ncbi:MAG: hypothetical protein KA177_07650 [Paludibacter sp.]|jgi:hypothetical protein|nr:hypothetical protein [Paludibacter sp.]
MKELRTKIVVLFTLLMFVSAWGFWWLQTALMPAGVIEAYPFIPLVFYFSGIVLVQTLYRLDKTNPRKLVNVYMLLKLLKMVIAGIMALIYLLVLHTPLKPFIIVFAAFYMLYLLFETFVFYSFEKQLKKERK